MIINGSPVEYQPTGSIVIDGGDVMEISSGSQSWGGMVVGPAWYMYASSAGDCPVLDKTVTGVFALIVMIGLVVVMASIDMIVTRGLGLPRV